MRRTLPLLLAIAFAAPAHAGVLTLGAHNVITVDGGGYVDVRLDRESKIFDPKGERGMLPWQISASRPDGVQALFIEGFDGTDHVAFTMRNGRLSGGSGLPPTERNANSAINARRNSAAPRSAAR